MILITIKDIRKIRPSADIPSDRLTPFIQEVQRFELKEVLGSAFYKALEDEWDANLKFTTTAYVELLDGKDYEYNSQTIHYYGLKDMMAYFVLSKFIIEQPVNIARYGIVQKTIDQSEPVSSSRIRMVSDELLSNAVKLRDELIQFLGENESTYTLYSTSTSKVQKNQTGFHFFPV